MMTVRIVNLSQQYNCNNQDNNREKGSF